jgi:DNA-directed RNA polymerase specialized sigma24 family protein
MSQADARRDTATHRRDETAGQQAADLEVHNLLRRSGFSEVYWRPCAERLVRVGSGVLHGWLRSGVMAGMLAHAGHGIAHIPPSLASDVESRDELVGEVLAEALVLFRRQLEQGAWDPAGRSLQSYFISGCLLVFPNVLRRWLSYQDREAKVRTALTASGVGHPAMPDHAAATEARLTLEALVAGENQRVVEVVKLVFDGYSSVEVAQLLQISPGAVRGVLGRWRSRAQKLWSAPHEAD